MKIFLIAFLLVVTACANHGKKQRLQEEHPNCEVLDDYSLDCPSPFTEEDVKGTNYERMSKAEIDELGLPKTKKVLRSCKMRETPAMDSRVVGFVPRGKSIDVERVSKDWFSYYHLVDGSLVYLGIKCFVGSPAKVRK